MFEMRSSLNILSTQAFPLHRLHHLCCLSQTSSYSFYLIFVLLTSPILGIAAATTLAFSEVGSLVDVADVEVHCTIYNFVAIINEVHSKAIAKETAVMSTRHTRVDVCFLCQRFHTSLRPNLIDHLLLPTPSSCLPQKFSSKSLAIL